MADEITKITNRVRRQIKGTDAQIEAFVSRLERFLDDNLSGVIDKIKSGKQSGAETAKILGSIFTELERAGLTKEIAKAKTIFAEELRFIRDEFTEKDFEKPLTEADSALVNALIDNSLDKIAVVIQEKGLNIQATVMQQVLTGEEVDYKKLKKIVGSTLGSNIQTEINTSVMSFNRTVTVNKAIELGFDLFVYIGPDDDVTRPFCKELLDRNPPIYTKAEIDGKKNGQGLAVFTSGGGYNCRHQWRPISAEDAAARGYKP